MQQNASGLYEVWVSDRKQRADRPVDSRSQKRDALDLARKLNYWSLKLRGPRAPLYYVLIAQEERKHG